MRRDLLLMTALGAIFLEQSSGKPTEIVASPDTLEPVDSTINRSSEIVAKRERRSPQYGLIGDYSDYSDYDDNSRHLRLGYKRKFSHKPHHKPLFGGCRGLGCGCRGLGCGGGSQPGYNQGSSFATASAGSISGGGGPYGVQSGANAQSSSISLGPFSATFSSAQATSGF